MIKVLHYVSIMNRGGQETFIMNVYRTIDRSEVQFDFLCALSQHGDYDDEIQSLGGHVYHINDGNKKFKTELIDNWTHLRDFLKAHGNDYQAFHIHTQHAMDGYLNAKAAKMAGIPKVIVHSHSTSTLYHPKLHYLFRPFLRKAKLTRFACSNLAAKWLYGDKAEYKVVCNGVDIERFKYADGIRNRVREDNGWSDKHVIGHVGSFTYPKNHEFIVEVFEQIAILDEKAILALVGAGEFREKIEALVKSKGLENRVQFLGSRSDVHELDQAFDLFLFPSRYEGLPVVLVEAQCTGEPCLISDAITTEIDVSPNAHRMSLNESPIKWAERAIQLIHESNNRENAYKDVVKAGYDIKDTADFLENYY